ncbi:GNAT family N-acetyltransferase [Pseudooceanicola nanhaiensis]|uniref:GNAT family N-acetyltransferase n=1 Tax=Pseudooceanicola nanhaiensis TaxID=375761 RepID=UPI001CD39974|nr:GNAT family N-acetyltransferase [Pseudooceanicola nanhaiensis]MCA0922130.1 GNAT family N-acetyltransferase [Pseudooceanicola nanhaiensis]
MITIPTLTTERLTLRAPALSDFDTLTAFYASDRSKFVGGPMTAELTWRQLATEIGHWQLRGFGRWIVDETASGRTIGMVGLWCPEGFPEPEVGWDLFEGSEGKGYATEAGAAARAYAYGEVGLTTLISLVKPANTPSARVCARLGAWHDSDFTHERWGALQVWRHPAPEDLAEGGMEAYA